MSDATVIDLSLPLSDNEQAPRRRSDRTEPSVADEGASGSWLIAGRYRVAGLLGRGGMADVFCAHDELLRRRVAVKVFATGQDVQRRADREMRTLANLRHVNLITVLDAGIDTTEMARPVTYLVMELIDGPTLAQRIGDGSLDPAEVADLGAQIATALSYVHDRGIVHRDVKPANILLAPHPCVGGPWTAKLTDFGIARVSDAASLTVTGLTIGTASYLSPEQALGQPIRPPSDIFSLGLVLLEALTGVRAPAGPAPDVALARIDNPPQVPAQLGPDWVRLLTAMTAQDPNGRPSAIQVAGALQYIRAAQTSPIVVGPLDVLLGGGFTDDAERYLPSPSGPKQPISADKRFRRMRWIVLTGLAAAIMAVSILAVGAVSRSHRPPSAPTPTVRLQAPRPSSTANLAGPANTGSHSRTAAPTASAARPQPPRTSPFTSAPRPTAASSPAATQDKRPSATTAATQARPSTSAAATAPSAGPTQSASAPPTSSSPPPPTSTPDGSPSADPSQTPSVPSTSRG